jgi:HD-GYP domain-containing protein (c-di-GMP phosphodiesterase class II)
VLQIRHAAVRGHDPETVRVSEVIAGLSRALDITEGHPQGHAARSCIIGMRIASLLGLPEEARTDLFFALLLKDVGCSSNAARVYQLFGGDDHAAKRAVWLRDWRRLLEKAGYGLGYAGRGEGFTGRLRHLLRLAAAGPKAERELFAVRCERGAAIALDLGLSATAAAAIRCMDEHWDGGGQPAGLRGEGIPLLARIVGLAQVLEIFSDQAGVAGARDVAIRRSGRWFDPAMVAATRPLFDDDSFWTVLQREDPMQLVAGAEPAPLYVRADHTRLDRIAEACASVIDAKSPYTSNHSRRVAHYAGVIGTRLQFDDGSLVRLRRAALLHDIGKLGVPNRILDKPGTLTAEEWAVVRLHPAHTFHILQAVPLFRGFAADASYHHEKLNGGGYPYAMAGIGLSPTARVLAVADITDALLADRPYRAGLDPFAVAGILEMECAEGGLCATTVRAMVTSLSDGQLLTPPSPLTGGSFISPPT